MHQKRLVPLKPRATWRAILTFVLALVLLTPSPAGAEPTRPFQFELVGGLDWNADTSLLAANIYLGYFRSLRTLSPNSVWFVGAGPRFMWGKLSVFELRGGGGDNDKTGRYALGGELRTGLAWSDDTPASLVYIALGFAPMYVWTSESVPGLSEPSYHALFPDAPSVFGLRTSLTAAFPILAVRAFERDPWEGLLFLLLPSAVSVHWEQLRPFGSSFGRFGVSIGYGF
ncbi:MAG: hypothetical protein H0U74_09135 [Bradymonadaceae bacterium]|nr:hypothetical protein [Lujinxingiaceae bacterium]